MTTCWRCKKDFVPEQSHFWPNMKETCAPCVVDILKLAGLNVETQFQESCGFYKKPVPDKLVEDVQKDPAVFEAEKIIGGRI